MKLLPSWLIIRKQWKAGPVNINLSKKGIGWSAGVRGARVGRNAAGRTFFEAAKRGWRWIKWF